MSKLVLNSGQYMFDGDQTITIADGVVVTKENLMLVTNTTTNEILYNFACDGFGGTLVGQVLTLEIDATQDQSSTDSLQIILEQTIEEAAASDPIIQVQLQQNENLVENADDSNQTLRNMSKQLKEIKDLLKLILS